MNSKHQEGKTSLRKLISRTQHAFDTVDDSIWMTVGAILRMGKGQRIQLSVGTR